jgi:hypothetical protein
MGACCALNCHLGKINMKFPPLSSKIMIHAKYMYVPQYVKPYPLTVVGTVKHAIRRLQLFSFVDRAKLVSVCKYE